MSGCAGWGLAPLASSDEGIGMWSADGGGRMEYVVPTAPLMYDVKCSDVQELGSSPPWPAMAESVNRSLSSFKLSESGSCFASIYVDARFGSKLRGYASASKKSLRRTAAYVCCLSASQETTSCEILILIS